MAAVQMMCARIGMVTGYGLAKALRSKFSTPVVAILSLALLFANIFNIGADLSGMADAAEMLTGVNSHLYVVFFGVGISATTVWLRYVSIANTLKWLALFLFAYVLTAFLVHPDWLHVMRDAVVPQVPHKREAWSTLVVILGTTISPYLFFWQTSQEVEEEKSAGRKSRAQRRGASRFELRIATIDVTVGMLVSNLVMYFIILSTALTLHANGKTDISTGADAAEALKPLAGNLAGVIFAVGMIGTGLLAVPVLSGASAYAVSETFGWREGLDEDWWRARPFYGVVALATLVGLVIPFTGVKPIDALFFTSVLNGVAAPFLLVVIMLAARNVKVMGTQTIGPILTALGWTVTIAMFAALVGLALTSLGS